MSGRPGGRDLRVECLDVTSSAKVTCLHASEATLTTLSAAEIVFKGTNLETRLQSVDGDALAERILALETQVYSLTVVVQTLLSGVLVLDGGIGGPVAADPLTLSSFDAPE
jgi:hypothetical protein